MSLKNLFKQLGHSAPDSMLSAPSFFSTFKVGNRYTPSGPTLAGAAKCAKQGHRGKITSGTCTRCMQNAG